MQHRKTTETLSTGEELQPWKPYISDGHPNLQATSASHAYSDFPRKPYPLVRNPSHENPENPWMKTLICRE